MEDMKEILFETAKFLTERMDEVWDKLSDDEKTALDQLKESLRKYEEKRRTHGEVS